ncbi:cupin domain-containing protein [Vagococcus coleopterorum]|uniref:Cupin domain-containing protein n=1 Tax=Vagococcus coleopterorum TaxID=2714946 RepID=A0A6G8AN76_9ENTE|nr:cupin domain-containing protein [Vagococcus coleopterorum]QIL46531.1 cupin domain-containing protein [Vagococcus coleopterorum]
MELKDYGKDPIVFNIEEATLENQRYRTTMWTGDHFQVTLMSIPAGGGDIGMEKHDHVDQFLRMEGGFGRVEMGKELNNITVKQDVKDGDCIIIPAGTWHNVTNIGDEPMKVYSIYGPKNHPFNAQADTKEEAEEQEHHDH